MIRLTIFLGFTIACFCFVSCRFTPQKSVEVVVQDLSGKACVGIVTVDRTAIPIMPYASASGLFYPLPGEPIRVRGNYFWNSKPFDIQTVISKEGYSPNLDSLSILILPDMTIQTKWGTSRPRNADDEMLIRNFLNVIPVFVRTQDDNLDLRPIFKQSSFSYRCLRYIGAGGLQCSYRTWLSIDDPEESIHFGYHLDDGRPFDGWKVNLDRKTILPIDTQNRMIVFEVDMIKHQIEIFHISSAENLDLLDVGVCSHDRVKGLQAIATSNMKPASPYRPKMIHPAYEETFVDLR